MIITNSEIIHSGTAKQRTRFAYFPKEVTGKVILWQRYYQLWVYEKRTVTAIIEGKTVDFIIGNWIKVAEKLK